MKIQCVEQSFEKELQVLDQDFTFHKTKRDILIATTLLNDQIIV